MNVLLIYPNIVEFPKDISLGLATISAMLKKEGHNVFMIDTTFKMKDMEIMKIVKNTKPLVVGVTAATNDLHNAIRISKMIKSFIDIPIVCGGYHATIAPEDIANESCFDVVAIGEAEDSFIKYIKSLELNKINYRLPNLWIKKGNGIIKNALGNLNDDLDKLPFADREIFDYQKYIDSNRGRATFMSSKGCPFECTYCINKVLIEKYRGKGKYLRFRSIDNIFAEIKQVMKNYKVNYVEFYDDTFTLNKIRLKEFCERYPREIGLPFDINARVNAVTEEDFRILKDAGCVRVSIGVESGDPKIRNNILKRNQTDEQIINTFKFAREAGLKTYSFNMIGIPFEDKKNIQRTIEINKKIKPDYIGVSIFNAFKGTALYNICSSNNWLIDSDSKSYFQSSNLDHPNFTKREIKKIRDKFGYEVYKSFNKKRAYIDLLDKKLGGTSSYNKIKSLLIRKGIKKFI